MNIKVNPDAVAPDSNSIFPHFPDGAGQMATATAAELGTLFGGGTDGLNGWTPVLAIVTDGQRRVQQVVDWAGGEGTKPTTGQYVGASGLVANIAQGVDIRGAQGPQGPSGGGGGGSVSYATRADIAALTATAGQYAYLVEDGREGSFVFNTGDYSDMVSADPLSAVYIAPASDNDGSSGAWVRENYPYVNVKWFGAKGDGVIDEANNTATGTDDTAAIQAGIDFLTDIKGGVLFFPDGVYVVSSPHNMSNGSNAQIWMPYLPTAEDALAITLRGRSCPIASGKSIYNAIICSNVNDNVGDVISSLIGIAGPSARSYINWYKQDITFRIPQATRHTVVDHDKAHMFSAERCRFDIIGGINNDIPSLQLPTFNKNYGVIGSRNFFPLIAHYSEVVIFGHYWGMRVGELAGGSDITVSGCVYPFELPECLHPSVFTRVLVLSCVYGLAWTGPHETHIATYDIEHTSLPPGWPARGADIVDPDNIGRGRIVWHLHDGTGEITKNGGRKIKLINGRGNPGNLPYYRLFDGMESVTTASGVDETAEMTPGASPFKVLVTSNTDPNGSIGAIVGANMAGGGTDKRRQQISFLNNGSENDGKISVNVAKSAALFPIVDFNGADSSVKFHISDKLYGRLDGNICGYGLLNGTSTTVNFNSLYTSVPVVVVSLYDDLGAGVRYWVQPQQGSFTVFTSAAVSNINFSWFAIGRELNANA